MNNITLKVNIQKPNKLKIIKNIEIDKNWLHIKNDRYYANITKTKNIDTFTNEKKVYSFLNESSATNFFYFLKIYNIINGEYPNFDNLNYDNIRNVSKSFNIYIGDEKYDELIQDCRELNIGLIGICNFNYHFEKNFKINMSYIDLVSKNECGYLISDSFIVKNINI